MCKDTHSISYICDVCKKTCGGNNPLSGMHISFGDEYIPLRLSPNLCTECANAIKDVIKNRKR